MASFSPQVPEAQPPSYLHLSKPIEQPSFKSVGGEAFKGTGEFVKDSLTGADKIVSAFAEQDTEKAIYPIRDQRMAELEAADKVLNPHSSVPDQGLLPGENGPPVPDDIRNLSGALDALKGARASGKLSDTDYMGRVVSKLQDIRSRYPDAYRDVIDATSKKILGVDAANERIRSLQAGINDAITNQNKEREHWLGVLRSSGAPGANQAYLNLLHGGSIEDASKFYYPVAKIDFDYKQRELYRQDQKGERSLDKDMWEQDADAMINGEIQKGIHATSIIPGIETMEKLQQYIVDVNAGRVKKPSPEQANELGNLMVSYKMAISQSIEDRASKPDANGNSFNKIVSLKTMKEKSEAGLSVLDRMEQAFRNEKYGIGFDDMRTVKAWEMAADKGLVERPGMRQFILTGESIRRRMGDSAYQKFLENSIQKGIMPEYEIFLKNLDYSIRGGPDLRKAGAISTYKEGIDQIAALKGKANSEYNIPKVLDAFIYSTVDGPHGFMSKDTDPETKASIAKAVVDPKNREMLKNISPDTYDDKGRFKPGQQAIFGRFARPDFALGMKAQGPVIFKQYEDFMKTTFEQDLFKNDLMYLKNLSLDEKGRFNLSWYTDREHNIHEFRLLDSVSGANYLRRMSGVKIDPTVQVISRINSGLRALANVADAAGKDPDEYILETLTDATGGAATGGIDLTKIPGVPQDMVRSIVNARSKILQEKQRMEEAKKLYRMP